MFEQEKHNFVLTWKPPSQRCMRSSVPSSSGTIRAVKSASVLILTDGVIKKKKKKIIF